MIAELRRVAPYFSGDYYPLTTYSLDDTAWMAWQFDRPDLSEGVVQAFRRADSYYETARFPLGGLESAARYVVTDLDSGRTNEYSGRELAQQGLKVAIDSRPGAAVLLYKKLAPRVNP
jgi:alpha-galactosidase